MTADQMTLARLRAFTRAFNDHDIAALLTQVAGDVALSRGDGGSLSGQAALAEVMQGLIVSCPDARLTPRETIAFGDGAVAALRRIAAIWNTSQRSCDVALPEP